MFALKWSQDFTVIEMRVDFYVGAEFSSVKHVWICELDGKGAKDREVCGVTEIDDKLLVDGSRDWAWATAEVLHL